MAAWSNGRLSAPGGAVGRVSESILQADHVSKSFGKRRAPTVRALSDVSLSVASGEALSIVGESGSGKSTLARCLTALHACTGGRVVYRGRDLAAMSGSERRAFHRKVQLVFQNPFSALNPRMTVAQTLGEALRVHRIVERRAVAGEIARLLALVRLPGDVLDRRPHEFSGGQLQRIAMARALSVRPEIIVADEVVSALDVSVQAQIVNLLVALQNELGVALVFIAHDLRLVRHISHRVAVMYRGTLVELGDSESLFTDPTHPYTRLLLASAPTLEPAQRTGPLPIGTGRSAGSDGSGCVFRQRCDRAIPRCATEAPRLRTMSPGRAAACHVMAA